MQFFIFMLQHFDIPKTNTRDRMVLLAATASRKRENVLSLLFVFID